VGGCALSILEFRGLCSQKILENAFCTFWRFLSSFVKADSIRLKFWRGEKIRVLSSQYYFIGGGGGNHPLAPRHRLHSDSGTKCPVTRLTAGAIALVLFCPGFKYYPESKFATTSYKRTVKVLLPETFS